MSAEYHSGMTSQTLQHSGQRSIAQGKVTTYAANPDQRPTWLFGLRHALTCPAYGAAVAPKRFRLLLYREPCCCAGPKIQQAVAARLKGYPQKAHRQMHRARVIVPAKVAAVLHADPHLAGPAVDAFYNRDVDDMQAAARMCHFTPQVMPKPNRCKTIAALWAMAMLVASCPNDLAWLQVIPPNVRS